MTFDIFSAINVGVGLGILIIGVLSLVHYFLHFRFDKDQERAAIRRLGWGLGLIGSSYTFTGVLGTLIANPEIVPMVAIVPLVARVIGGVFIWELIRWVLFVFYPTQKWQR